MTDIPKFSIITVCRNHLNGLQKTQNSLENQSFQDFEWVIIDGASQDETPQYLRALPYSKIISEPDNGPYDAMNKGIAFASGQYYIFLNAGDCLANPDTLALIDDRLQKNPADFMYGDSYEGYKNKRRYKKARSYKRALLGMFTHHQSMIYKAELLNHLRYDTRYHIAADYDFTLRFLASCESVLRLRLPICIFEQGGISQKQAKLGRREQRKIRRELKLCSPFVNNLIMQGQKLNMMLRRFSPRLYWLSKRASRH